MKEPLDSGFLIIIVTTLLATYLTYRKITQISKLLPPGPRRWPIIGNLFDLPKGYDWLYWAKHKELYGPISSITVMGTNIIIVNDIDIVLDLLDKRSAIYSDRPQLTMAGELVGWKEALSLANYGDGTRTQRKYIHQVMGTPKLVSQFFALQDIEAKRFVQRLIEDSTDIPQKIRT